MMGRDEAEFAPEWYKAAKGGKTSKSNSGGNGIGLSSKNRLSLIPRNGDSMRSGTNRSKAYSSLDRRDRRKNADVGYSRTDKDTGVVLPNKNVSNCIRRHSSFNREFPSLRGEDKRVGKTSSQTVLPLATSKSGSWSSLLVDLPDEVGGIVLTLTGSLGRLSMAESLFQEPSQVGAAPKLSSDTFVAGELILRQCKQLIPKTQSMSKSPGLKSSEKSKSEGSTKDGDFGSSPKSGPCASAARNEVLRSPQIGNLQVLNREKASVTAPTTKDVRLKTPTNGNLKAEFMSTNSSKLSLRSSGVKKALSLTQNRKDFFNSLRNKTLNTPKKPFLLGEQNAGNCDDASFVKQEEDSSDGFGVTYKDSANTSHEEMHTLPEKDGENKQPRCSECMHHPADLDERDKAFLRALGWDENAGDECLTAEEISAFVKEYEKLKPFSKFSHRVEALSLSMTQTS